MNDIIYLDLFSGIGGFHLGIEQSGFKFKKTYFSEIDKHAIKCYQEHFKEAIYVGSVTSIPGIERPNIITFGSPCQDFSLAGKRRGLEGERSSLITFAIDLIKKYRPDFFVWENVKGTFSSNNGADFWAIIQEFTNIGGYRLEWQLLNTAWFLPQNRERIYLVGCLGEGSGQQIFPVNTRKTNNIKQKNRVLRECVNTLTKSYGKISGCSTKICTALDANYFKGIDNHGARTFISVNDEMRVLTPTECERLQGFPDGWTSMLSDTQRYKTIGNAVSVPVVKAVFDQIKKVYYE